MSANPDSPKQHRRDRQPQVGARVLHRVVLIEDHPIASSGLTDLLNHERDLVVCGVATDYSSAIEKVEALRPELVLLDITLKGRSGLELLKDLKARHPKLKVVVLSMHDESLYAERALRAGAAGYVMKHEATEKVLTAIKQVLNGEIYLSEAMEKKMLHQLVGTGAAPTGSMLSELSDRELEIFNLIGQGRTTRQIAEELHLSVKTIESHRAHIKQKLNLKTATELVQYAIQCQEG